MQEVLLHAEALDTPSCAPDVGLVGYAVGRLFLLFYNLGEVTGDSLPYFVRERLVVDQRQRTADEPASPPDVFNDPLPVIEQDLPVLGFARAQEKLDRGVDVVVEAPGQVSLFPVEGFRRGQAFLGKRRVVKIGRAHV